MPSLLSTSPPLSPSAMARLFALAAAAAALLCTATASAAPCTPFTPPPILTDQLCDVCTWAWSSAQDMMAKPENQKALMHLLEDDACGILPSSQAAACKEAAREYVPPAIAALLSFDAKEACGSAGLCPPSGGATSLPRPTPALVAAVAAATTNAGAGPPLRGVPCPMCRLAVNNVKLQLEDPENQAAVLAKAAAVCAAMPPEVAPQCNAFVATNAPKVFAIADDIDPNKLCDIVGACPPQVVEDEATTTTTSTVAALLREQQARQPSPPLADDSSACDTCKALLDQAASAIKDPATQRQVLAYAAKLCGSLRTMADACVADVQSYGPAAFETLQQYLTPGTCVQMGLCPSSCGGGGGGAWRHPGEVLVRPGGVETA